MRQTLAQDDTSIDVTFLWDGTLEPRIVRDHAEVAKDG
jgi:hypothetical protein